jgi:hypothetical protein
MNYIYTRNEKPQTNTLQMGKCHSDFKHKIRELVLNRSDQNGRTMTAHGFPLKNFDCQIIYRLGPDVVDRKIFSLMISRPAR